MKQRIVFDCERMKHENTGLFYYCLSLGRYLQKYADKKLEEIVYYSPSQTLNNFRPGSPYLLQDSLQKFYMPSLKDFTVWHSTYQLSRYIPRRNKRIKVVLTIHDLNFLYDKPPDKRSKYLYRLQHNIDRSDAIVCISDFSRKDILTHCHTGNKPVHVIHNGTNTLHNPGLYSHSYKPERPFLFSLGVMCRKKNFHVLLPLLQRNHGMELLIAGRLQEPKYLQFIHQSARQMRVEQNVRVLGDISEREKSWYYQNCYAFALPSIAEGFGLPVTEAMSAGKPVFLSNKTALPEIGSNAAFYFRDFNATHMQQVFEEGMAKYESQNMQQMIRERSAAFCWEKAAQEYLAVYRSLY